jgi:nitroreductase
MQVSHAIRERRSIRAFLPNPIPAETVRQIIDLAKWAPSWANAQDWHVYVLQGVALEKVRAAYVMLGADSAEAQTDLPMPPSEWPDYLAERMAARRPSAEAPAASSLTGRAEGPSVWNFYSAPCLLLMAIDEDLESSYASFDAGLFVQTLCLAAEDRGYATCVMAMAVRYADILHEVIPQAHGKRFVIGVALGSADHAAVVNRGERKRVETGELATFVDGEE